MHNIIWQVFWSKWDPDIDGTLSAQLTLPERARNTFPRSDIWAGPGRWGRAFYEEEVEGEEHARPFCVPGERQAAWAWSELMAPVSLGGQPHGTVSYRLRGQFRAQVQNPTFKGHHIRWTLRWVDHRIWSLLVAGDVSGREVRDHGKPYMIGQGVCLSSNVEPGGFSQGMDIDPFGWLWRIEKKVKKEENI